MLKAELQEFKDNLEGFGAAEKPPRPDKDAAKAWFRTLEGMERLDSEVLTGMLLYRNACAFYHRSGSVAGLTVELDRHFSERFPYARLPTAEKKKLPKLPRARK